MKHKNLKEKEVTFSNGILRLIEILNTNFIENSISKFEWNPYKWNTIGLLTMIMEFCSDLSMPVLFFNSRKTVIFAVIKAVFFELIHGENTFMKNVELRFFWFIVRCVPICIHICFSIMMAFGLARPFPATSRNSTVWYFTKKNLSSWNLLVPLFLKFPVITHALYIFSIPQIFLAAQHLFLSPVCVSATNAFFAVYFYRDFGCFDATWHYVNVCIRCIPARLSIITWCS